MYKVLFAEDELLVRLGLQNSIPWSKYEMEVAALADNGMEAYRLFEEIRPDILITDLRMEGMDGLELVKRVREIDKECAIVVISCLNDFETLRKLIPYNINAYVLKASISIDEVCNVLEQTKEYLISIGRTAKKVIPDLEKPEDIISKYLLGDAVTSLEDDFEIFEHLLLFSLEEENKDKINKLAMDFIYELVNRQIPGEMLVPLKDKEFCVFYRSTEKKMDERIKRINNSIGDFLGVRFKITHSSRRKAENLKDWFDRAYVQQYEINIDENSGKALIQKSIEYMQEHFRESLTLTDISRTIGLSVSYFSYLFKQETGKNYIEYLNEIRLLATMKDLMNTDEKVVVVAQKNGFQNLEYFSRYFKKQTGESPARWRKLNR
ncbi:DNA-binding helix-turn-helix protein [Lachnoanaerobaculum sp. MSX33]|uniref:response regulator transcription factor n=1 Tax=Lachnoanaerobaculum sp. MSX33 TaxID=936596 RepID=UPI0003DF9EF5|nr:helix-turn-helix domain-containing protein [Lachnoanaerobaculum sp. MSX33]ETO98958.1 DNA-binding helix-turn-helix protein [Lachnoanaerobaculum sp. MSX33]